jgi:hypothetical protein
MENASCAKRKKMIDKEHKEDDGKNGRNSMK